MIKAVGTTDKGETIVLFGLSEMNLRKLREGHPIPVEMEELGFKGKVIIIYGETEDSLKESFTQNMEIGEVVDKRNRS